MKPIIYNMIFVISTIFCQQNGDAVYREGGWLNNQDHAGIYCSNCNNGSEGIIHITYGHHPEIVSWSEFLAGNTYHNAFSVEGLNSWDKQQIVQTALLLAEYYYFDIDYSFADMLVDNSYNSTITPSDIEYLRCDGLVEYSYEFNTFNVWGISDTGNMYGEPHHFNVSYEPWSDEHDDLAYGNNVHPWYETSPKVQRGAYGYKWTTFRPTSGIEGDINGDYLINVVDIVEIISNFILCLWDPPYWSMADINDDYQIDILDVVLLVETVIGEFSGDEYPDETIYINKIVEQRSSPPFVLLVNMINPTVVLGMQMTIKLDPGYKAVEVNSGEYSESTNMTLSYSISPDSTTIKYLYYGPNGESFPADGYGTILEIGMVFNGSQRTAFNPEGMSLTEMLLANNGNNYLEAELIDLIRYEEITDEMSTDSNFLPAEYKLDIAYPNPFNPRTTLKYELPKDGKVSIIVYDMLGREVIQLVDDYKKAGYHTVRWDAASYSSGVYFVKLIAGNFSAVQKLSLVK